MDRSEPCGIDLLDQLHVARQKLLQNGHGPLLKRLRHHRVVGVRQGLLRDLPGLVELQSVDVNQKPHQLRDGNGRMGIVHLEAGLLRELLEVAVLLQETSQSVLERGCDEEVLLLQTKLLSFLSGVVRVQDGHDLVSLPLVKDGLIVLAGIERLQVELLHGFAVPQPEIRRGRGAIPWDRDVASDGLHVLGRGPRPIAHRSVKAHGEADGRPTNLPRVSGLGNPLVRDLHLLSVRGNALLEHTVAVTDTVAPARQVQRGHRVQEARRQASQSSVSKGRVDLRTCHRLKIRAKGADRVGVLTLQPQVVDGVGHRAAHEELSRQVVHKLRILLLPVLVRTVERVHQPVMHRPGSRGIRSLRLVASTSGLPVLELVRDLLLDILDGAGPVLALPTQQVRERAHRHAPPPGLRSASGEPARAQAAIRLLHASDSH
mmetsp:Transcript_1165/g.3729  ORF Transcript_1165/g.3729 Transcript_1165/m.3729 type:complete len:431 (+) Transcript_1165:2411-3703(+)